jgi:hypothetical protein
LRASSKFLSILRPDPNQARTEVCGVRQDAVVLRQLCGAHALRFRRSKSIASDQPALTEMIRQQLGAATMMLCRQQLPPEAQLTILNRTDDTIGFTPVPNVRTEIYGRY